MLGAKHYHHPRAKYFSPSIHPPPLPHLFYNCLLIPDISMGYYHSKNQDFRIALVHYDQGLQPQKTNGYFEAFSKKSFWL